MSVEEEKSEVGDAQRKDVGKVALWGAAVWVLECTYHIRSQYNKLLVS